MPDLTPLFSPESVAIIGASADTHTLRGRTTQYLIAHRYPGRIYPVTRSLPEVFGLRSYATVAELPEAPDLAVVVVPAAYVVPTLEECGRKGVRAAVVISSGFAEERGEAAQERARALREVDRSFRHRRLRAQFGRSRQSAETAGRDFQPGIPRPSAKSVSRKPQKPGDRGQLPERCIDLRVFEPRSAAAIALHIPGQRRQPDLLEAHDYVDWLLDTGGADIFLAYLEGIRDTARFRAVADKAAAAAKPLIVAKVGRSEAGRRAAASHTGALANSGVIDDAIFRHHGIIRGEDLDHMLDMAAAFAFCKLPRGNRVAVITGSGGSAVWMSDILSAHGLELPVLEEDLQQRLMALLPSYASAQNPVDGTAQAIHEVGYAKLVEIVRAIASESTPFC